MFKTKWLDKRKRHTAKFIIELSSIKIGKFVIIGKEIFQVQNNNPIKELLKKAFDIVFEFVDDKTMCGLNR